MAENHWSLRNPHKNKNPQDWKPSSWFLWESRIRSPHVTLAGSKVQPLKSCCLTEFETKCWGDRFFWGSNKKGLQKSMRFFSGCHAAESERIMLFFVGSVSLAQHLEGRMFAFLWKDVAGWSELQRSPHLNWVITSVGVNHQQKKEETKAATHLDQDFLSLIFRSVANPQLGWAKQMFLFWGDLWRNHGMVKFTLR